jgi:predicted CXXCH cytochrome family protein
VHPLRLPETCARCHADAARMAKYKIATNQFAEYRESVHWEAVSKRRDLSAPSCASCHGNHGAAPPQVASVAAVCGTCHAMIEDLYKASPHAPAFAAMNMAGCVTCHSNHAVHKPSDAMLAGSKAVCAGCHGAEDEGGKAAAGMAGLITKLDAALDRSDAILARASRDGMEISEAMMKQRDGREALVKARVAVHTFRTAAVRKAADQGLVIASETQRAGEEALRERDFRRFGLGIALIAIAITIIGLWLAIRSIERQPSAAVELPRR